MSSFTALNGADQKPTEPVIKVADEARPASSGRPNGQPSIASSSTLPEPPKPTDGGREPWSNSAQERPTPYSQPTYTETENSHKRKRSDAEELRRDQPLSAQERSPRDEPARTPLIDSRRPYDSREREYRRYGDDHREREGWYTEQSRDKQSSYEHSHSHQSQRRQTPPPHPSSEDRHSDSARRDMDYPNTSPDADDRSISVYTGSPYTADGRKDSVIQMDPKKRKRNFSNRTKTGCMTCRKRKKKCDEQKPECINCLRGGFLCAGYPPQRGPVWQKPDNKASAIPLESKDPSYVPPGAYGMPQQQPSQQQSSQSSQSQQNPYATPTSATSQQQPPPPLPQPHKRDPISSYRGQPLRIDPPQGRPLVSDDDRHTASTIPSASVASPDNKLSALSSYTPGASVFPTPVSANAGPAPPFSERVTKEYQRVPPLHDLTRTEPDTPHHGTTLPQINILHPTRTNSPITHQTATSSAQVAAQLALAHTQFPPTTSRLRTQKEDMLAGRHFYPFDKELVLERERCNTACWRFNNSMNPNNGVSPVERARLFREILHPRDPIQVSPSLVSQVTNVGRVGESVVVEAPFVCDYGYNISIGQNVVIGRNCTITDTCEVKIGDNCHIGPNVSIYTTSLPIDPKRRMGSKGPQLGKPVTIEPDCWIGGGAIILPGRTIGKGSTVGAGSIVTRDVPPFTVVVGNPAKVIKGVAS